ncbi:hypothetical protein CC80DRAFT_506337 [Byssothecium circinans]|uniref:Uncharacterized protein n=1 Tax=Byssothecium circinans TaxID=147558 RepID=A0A6A5TPY1_9PLEO|nr:hypothetical protein CC80DRAFT_506337 [Byssothecium circinans]
MARFTSLAAELLIEIVSYFDGDTPTLARLCLVSKTMRDIAQAPLYTNMTLRRPSVELKETESDILGSRVERCGGTIFLVRTLCDLPKLQSKVRSLDIVALKRDIDNVLYQPYENLDIQAVKNAALPYATRDSMGNTRDIMLGYEPSLAGLVLRMVPKLRRLTISISGSTLVDHGIRMLDPLRSLFGCWTDTSHPALPPIQPLEELTIPVEMSSMLAFTFPKLEKLKIRGFDELNLSDTDHNSAVQQPQLKHVHIEWKFSGSGNKMVARINSRTRVACSLVTLLNQMHIQIESLHFSSSPDFQEALKRWRLQLSFMGLPTSLCAASLKSITLDASTAYVQGGNASAADMTQFFQLRHFSSLHSAWGQPPLLFPESIETIAINEPDFELMEWLEDLAQNPYSLSNLREITLNCRLSYAFQYFQNIVSFAWEELAGRGIKVVVRHVNANGKAKQTITREHLTTFPFTVQNVSLQAHHPQPSSEGKETTALIGGDGLVFLQLQLMCMNRVFNHSGG